MNRWIAVSTVLAVVCLFDACRRAGAAELPPIPEKLVVLRIDDGCKSALSVVAPILNRHGSGATFFVTDTDSMDRPGGTVIWPTRYGDLGISLESGLTAADHPSDRVR